MYSHVTACAPLIGRELYIVWAEKTNLMKLAADTNHFNSSYFLWLDIVAVRHKVEILHNTFYILFRDCAIYCLRSRPVDPNVVC